jgi:N-acetylmuramoyl-L-alanine amidase
LTYNAEEVNRITIGKVSVRSMKKLRILIIKKKIVYIFIAAFFIVALMAVFVYLQFIKVPANIFLDPCNGVIVIDPGHGGIDGGTSKEDVVEKDINLYISLKLKTYLEQKGYTVFLTRTEDISLDELNNASSSRHQRDLHARLDMINNSNAQIFLSIHCNCHSKNVNAKGSIVFYNNSFVQNKTLAYCLQRSLNNMVINGNKRIIHDPQVADFFLLKYSNIPGVIAEMAFISNSEERQLLKTDEFKAGLAKAIANGVDKYLESTLTKKKVFAFHF